MSRMSRLIATLVVAVALNPMACVSKSSKGPSEKDKAAVEKYILDKVPEDMQALGTTFEDKVTLLGYTVSPKGTLKPDQKVKLTLYWRADKEIGEKGWGLFTHLYDGAGKRIGNIDNAGPLRKWRKTQQALPPSDWKPGKVYADELSFSAPKKNSTSVLEVSTGIWKGSKRLEIKSGEKSNDNRAVVAKLSFAPSSGAKKRSTKVPSLQVDRLDDKAAPIKIDGKLDEEAWKTAATSGPFVNVRTGERDEASPVQGSVRVLWNSKDLFLGFEVSDSNIVGGFDKASKDPPLWTKDAVEVMIDPDGDGDNKDYYEIQVNPQNLVFDSQFDEYNKPKTEPNGPFGHQEWSAKLESAVVIDGTLDKPDDKDKGYTVEIRIPWASFSKAKKTPPAIGDQWRMNFYAMQDNSGVGWSPILGQGNFHKASRFGKILWAEKGWKGPADQKKESESAEQAKLQAAKGSDDPKKSAEGAAGATGAASAGPAKRTIPSPAPGALRAPNVVPKSTTP